MSCKIAPSLLSADFSCLKEEVQKIEKAGADWIHIDVMDGHFVPNLTLGPPVVKSLRPVTNLPFDVHLMVENPESLIEPFAEAGADYLTFHIESVSDPLPLLKKIRECKMKTGLTFCPQTSYKELLPYLDQVDLLLIMTVNPGRGGQVFLEDQAHVFHKIRMEISKLKNPPLLSVDGGIQPETAQKVLGADILVSGSYLFGSADYTQALSSLKEGFGS